MSYSGPSAAGAVLLLEKALSAKFTQPNSTDAVINLPAAFELLRNALTASEREVMDLRQQVDQLLGAQAARSARP